MTQQTMGTPLGRDPKFTGEMNGEALVLDQGLGVGTKAPARLAELVDAASPQLRLTHEAGAVYADFHMNAEGDLIITAEDGTTLQSFQFMSANSSYLIVGGKDDDGNSAVLRLCDQDDTDHFWTFNKKDKDHGTSPDTLTLQSKDGTTTLTWLTLNPSTVSLTANQDFNLATGKVLTVAGIQVVGARQTGVSAMTNLTAPANLDADTCTVGELADIVGNLIAKLRAHGLVAD